jgi:ribosome recycling factor
MNLDEVKKQCKQQMGKAVDYFQDELKGVRTGRAHPGLVEHLKVPVSSYGSTMELRELAAITAPESALLIVKPFDPGTIKDIEKAILSSNLGFTPHAESGAIRLPVAPLSGERRQQLIQEIRRMSEAQKVAIRNLRRDTNRHIDQMEKDHKVSEDEAEQAREEVQKFLKQFESQIDDRLKAKQKELETV